MKKILSVRSIFLLAISFALTFLFSAKPVQANDFDLIEVGEVVTKTIEPEKDYSFNVIATENAYYTMEVLSATHEEYWTYMEGMNSGYYSAGEEMNCYINNHHADSDLTITFRMVLKNCVEHGQLTTKGKTYKADMAAGEVHRYSFCADKTTTYCISYGVTDYNDGTDFQIYDANMNKVDDMGFFSNKFPPLYGGYRLVKCKKGKIYYVCFDATSSENPVPVSVQYNYGYPTKIKSITPSGSGLKITWNKCSDASGYYIYRYTSSNFYKEPAFNKSKPIKTITKASTCSYVDSKRTNGKTCNYLVIPFKKSSSKKVTYGNCEYYEKYYYLSPVSGIKATNVKGKKIKVSWKKNSKCMGYQVKYTLGSKSKTVNIPRYDELKKTIASLKKGKTYKIYVRSYYRDDEYTIFYSKWSSAKSVKVKK